MIRIFLKNPSVIIHFLMPEGQFQRNPMNGFRGEFRSVDFGLENGPLIPSWVKQEPSLFAVYGILAARKE